MRLSDSKTSVCSTDNHSQKTAGSFDPACFYLLYSFLENVIITERAKEEAFLTYLKTRTEKYLELKFPSIESNWNDFVLDI